MGKIKFYKFSTEQFSIKFETKLARKLKSQ